MTEQELINLCDTNNVKHVHKGIYFSSPFWTAEIYGFGNIIRKYGYYPNFLPLNIYTDHGPGGALTYDPFPHELESKAACQLYHSPNSVKEWKKRSDKPCHVLMSPFVFYRKENKIEQNKDAKGTIVFPAHSTTSIENSANVQEYINQLKDLPKEFHPISACIHMHDVRKGLHKLFIESGIPVYTAGNSSDYRFPERFYSILKKFKYSSSNLVGSYTLYSVEMGIPFFIYGQREMFINNSDTNFPIGKYDPYEQFPIYKKYYDLFSGFHKTITEEQAKLSLYDLGVYEGISRKKMAWVLYYSLLKWLFSMESLKWLMRNKKGISFN